MATEIAALVEIGERMNYEGERLNQFVKEQQDLLREERMARRAEEKAQLEIEFYKVQAEKEERKLAMEIQLEEARRVPLPGSEEGNNGNRNMKGIESWAIKLIPKFRETDVPKFFSAFEKVANQMAWDRENWPVLIQTAFVGRAQVVYASLDEDDSKSYEVIKEAILDAYELIPEAHRQKFRKLQRGAKQSYWEFARDKEMLLDEWLRSVRVDEFSGLREILLLEDFKNNLPSDLRKHIEEFNLDTLEKAAKAADRYELTHKTDARSYVDRGFRRKSQDVKFVFNKQGREGKFNNSSNVKCYFCGKLGHMQRECRWISKGKIAFTVKKDVTREQKFDGRVADKDMKMYGEFITKGIIKEEEKVQTGRVINALRDTGASHSCVLKSVVPIHMIKDTKEYILLAGFLDSVLLCPVVEMFLDIGYVRAPVKLAVVESLPVNGIDVLVGNETTRRKSDVRDIIQINLEHEGNVLAVTRNQVERKDDLTNDVEEQEDKVDVVELTDRLWNRESFLKEQVDDKTLEKTWKELYEDEANDLSKPRIVMKDGMLYRKMRSKHARQQDDTDIVWQIVVPRIYRKKLLLEAHDNPWSGHFGIDKTFHHVVKYFWWPKIKQDVRRMIKTCHDCQVVGKPNANIPKAPLQPVKVTGNPFSHLVLDIVGPLPKTTAGNEYMLSIIDRVTRYPEAIPVRKVSSKVIINHLVQYFSHFGFPQSIQTDRGTYFTSKEFTKQLENWNIQQKLSTPYHPESQGLVERLHQTLKNSLTKYCHNNISNWDKQLPYVLFALRSMHNVSLGFSPFQIIYGHEVNGPMEIIKNKIENVTLEDNSLEQLLVYKEKLKKTKEWSMKNLEEAQTVMKEKADRKSKVRKFQVGDTVLVLLPSPGQLKVKYSGPGVVKKKVNDLNYEVSLPGRRRTTQVFHVNLLKLYEKSDDDAVVQMVNVNGTVEQAENEMDILQISDKVDYQWVKLNKETSKTLEEKIKHLDKFKQEEVRKLCNAFHEVFSDRLGNAIGIQHEVKLKPGSTPIRQAPYKMNPKKAKEVRDQVEYMLQQNLIERSKSPWSSPVVVVPKKDGGYRLCVDYRKVNELTISDSFPIPRIEDCIERIGEAKFVSKIDLLKGYWQIPLAPEAKEISAFVTPEGLFQCKVMPFGMKNASGTFQRLMTEITSPLQNCLVYLDDLVIFDNSWVSHMENLEKLFQELRKNNLVINLSKCEFAHAEVVYLGHKVGNGKISPKDSNVEAILNFPVPCNRKQVRQFLGLCGYYRRYVPNYADLACPLTDLLKKDCKFIITSEVEKAINQIKSILSSFPILRTPDWDKPFEILIDASNVGIGAVLCQENNKIKHPVAFFSKKLNKHQMNYSTVEKECLALVMALQHFEIYVTNGKHVTSIFSDHNPLVYIHRFKNKNRRLMSWSWIIQEFNLQIHHIKGKDNTIADALSRAHQE